MFLVILYVSLGPTQHGAYAHNPVYEEEGIIA